MALMDEFREERENVKNGTLKQKFSYFWDYYKWYVIVPLIVIVFLGTTIYQKITAPEIVLNGVLLNTHNTNADEGRQKVINDFSELQKIDTKEYEVTLNTSMTLIADDTSGTANYESMQALMAWVAAGSVDFISADHAAMTDLAYKGYFVDLREFLSKDEIKKYEPYFLYMDASTSTALDEAIEKYDNTASFSIPDCSEPETMEKPIPVMIDLSKNPKFSEIYAKSDSLALGIATNAPNKDMLLAFLDFLVEK